MLNFSMQATKYKQLKNDKKKENKNIKNKIDLDF